MLSIISHGKLSVKVPVEIDKRFPGRGLFVGMDMIGHYTERPGDYSILPCKMIIEGYIKNAVLDRIKDDVSADCLAKHMMRTTLVICPVILTHNSFPL